MEGHAARARGRRGGGWGTEEGSNSSAGSAHELESVPLFSHDNSKLPGSPVPGSHGMGHVRPPHPGWPVRVWSYVAVATLAMLAISVFALHPHTDAAQPSQSVNFITVNGTRFMDGCREFFVAGINVDNIVEAAIPAVSSRKVAPGVPTGRQMVSDLLSSAAASDLNLLRTWAHTTDPSHPLQISPGACL